MGVQEYTPCTTVVRNFAQLFVVSSRQRYRSNDEMALRCEGYNYVNRLVILNSVFVIGQE